jgi:hypothetical protein
MSISNIQDWGGTWGAPSSPCTHLWIYQTAKPNFLKSRLIPNIQDSLHITINNSWPATPKTLPTVGSPETSTTTTTTPDTDHLRSIKPLLPSTLQLHQFINPLLQFINPLLPFTTPPLPPTNPLPLTSQFRLPLTRFTRTNRTWT